MIPYEMYRKYKLERNDFLGTCIAKPGEYVWSHVKQGQQCGDEDSEIQVYKVDSAGFREAVFTARTECEAFTDIFELENV